MINLHERSFCMYALFYTHILVQVTLKHQAKFVADNILFLFF